jgi:hypothetical protein
LSETITLLLQIATPCGQVLALAACMLFALWVVFCVIGSVLYRVGDLWWVRYNGWLDRLFGRCG